MKIFLLILAAIILAGCQHNVESGGVAQVHEFTQNTKVVDVINCKSFGGRLFIPELVSSRIIEIQIGDLK